MRSTPFLSIRKSATLEGVDEAAGGGVEYGNVYAVSKASDLVVTHKRDIIAHDDVMESVCAIFIARAFDLVGRFFIKMRHA